jgi:tRNA wybutosine-synthesizing protein 2
MGAVAPGGTIHCHAAVPEAELGRTADRVRAAAADAGRAVASAECRRVKSHSEGVVHVVIDAAVE